MHRLLLSSVFGMALVFGAAQAAGPFDGVYRGTWQLTGGGASKCRPGGNMAVAVRDGVFTWHHPDGPTTEVTVGANGTFQAGLGQRFITGRVEGATLIASTTGQNCTYSWSLRR